MTTPQVTVPVEWFERLLEISRRVKSGVYPAVMLEGYISSAELIIKQEKTE